MFFDNQIDNLLAGFRFRGRDLSLARTAHLPLNDLGDSSVSSDVDPTPVVRQP